jgi:hypothetical protein
MNSISTLKTAHKTVFITGSLLIGLALAPAVSIADNARHEGYSNKKSQNSERQQRDHRAVNRQQHKAHDYRGHRQHDKGSHNHREARRHDSRYLHNHHHSDRHYKDVRYVVYDRPYYPGIIDRFGLQVGIHTGNFDIVFRD